MADPAVNRDDAPTLPFGPQYYRRALRDAEQELDDRLREGQVIRANSEFIRTLPIRGQAQRHQRSLILTQVYEIDRLRVLIELAERGHCAADARDV